MQKHCTANGSGSVGGVYFEWPITFGRVSAARAVHTVRAVVFGLISETCNFCSRAKIFATLAKIFSPLDARDQFFASVAKFCGSLHNASC